ncbi:MAG TPA: pyruvate formate lyase family protein [Candidatus Hydrogenedentes bacterium]|nr:pyruvate formate lyase family protein [Candidatus Hydrogenedentota bacterium]HPG65764.1 pyruvate formate lyase family protein [Candidatus Hydrogenedentota bacterium]
MESKGLSASLLQRLRDDVMERKGSFVPRANPFARDVALWRAWRPGQTVGQTRARLLLELVALSPIEIRPDWTLAGEHLCGHQFGLACDQCRTQLARMHEFGLDDHDIHGVLDCFARWRDARTGATAGEPFDEIPRANAVYTAGGWVENHSVRDYAKVLAIGFDGVRQEIQRRVAEADMGDPAFAEKEAFWKAGIWVCEAGCLLGSRYADLAEVMADDANDVAEKARLEGIARSCRRVPAQRARTLREAVQSLWLAHILTCGEDSINANSIGRLDQLLNPYYQSDLEAGRITRDEAVTLMEELACKLYLDYDVQAITLGGVDREGNDACNEMSLVILDATGRVEFVRDVSVRLHRGSPDALVNRAAALMARGGGIPFVFNDECFVPALEAHGIALEDARNYAPIGCIELTVPGRANPHAVSGWFNAAKCIELALFDGVDPRTGEQLGPHTGLLTDFGTYEALLEAYRRQVVYFTKRMVYGCNRGELAQREHGPLPCWSVLTDDCIERGRDITDGGPVYNYHSICFIGNGNAADSLCALKKLVFEEGSLDASDVLDALRADYDGYESLRQRLLNGAPKYGNDDDEVDAIAAQVAGHFINLMDEARSPLGGRYFVHLFSFLWNLHFGHLTGATPDGRRGGDPLAYSLSAHQGRDQRGVTAMLRSLSKMPHGRAAGASAAIVDLDPKLVEGDAGAARLAHLLRTAIGVGVGQLQLNVTTVERLRQAQADPEHYGNLAVRVAGYPQMFIKLLTEGSFRNS